MAEEVAIAGAIGGLVILTILLFFALFAGLILGFIFWIFMLIDVAKRNFHNDNDKIMWILIVVLTGIIGAAIYYFIVRKPEGPAK